MEYNRSTVTTLLMVALVALAGIGAFAGGASAATTTLNGDGNDTVSGFTANESNDLAYSISSSGTDFSTDGTNTLKMNVTLDGTEYALTEEAVDSGTSSSQTVNISNDELADLPGDAGENTTVNVTAWGTDGNGTVTTTATEFAVDITFDSSYAVVEADDSSATIEEPEEPGFFSMDTVAFWSSSDDDPADIHTYEQIVGVNGSETTVTVNDATSNGSDAFDEAVGDDLESGDVIYGASAAVDGTPVLAFYQSADSEIVEDGDTYAVYDKHGNGDWTFTLGDDYSDASEVDVFVSSQSMADISDFSSDDRTNVLSQADMGMTSALSTFGFGALGAFNLFSLAQIPFMGGMAVAFVVPAVPAGRRLAA